MATRHDPGAEGAMRKATEEIEVLALVKGAEYYVFLFRENNREELFQVLGRFAVNPELSFTWWDCAVLCQRVREGK